MLGPRILYITALAADILVFISTNTRPPLVAAIVMTAVPAVSFLYLYLFMRTLKLNMTVPSYTETNKKTEVVLELSSRLPVIPATLFLHRTVTNKLFGETQASILALDIRHGKRSIAVPFETSECGVREYKIDRIRCFDSLHLFSLGAGAVLGGECTVYPNMIELNTLFLPVSSPDQPGMVYDPFKKGNNTGEILEMRDYHFGDNIRNIHWKVSARFGKPVVREFARPNNYNTMILCDLALSTNGKKTDRRAVSNNIVITSALSRSLINHGTEHSVCLMNEAVSKRVGVANQNEHVRLVTEMVNLRLSGNDYNTAAAFLSLGLAEGVSKLVFVTREYDHAAVRMIAENIDVTVVVTNSDGRNTVEKGEKLKIVSLDENSLGTSAQNVLI